MFKVLASSFWGRWWEISLCCCHPLEYDLGVVLYVVCHFVHAVWYCTLARLSMRLLSLQNSILTWLQRRIAVAVLNVLDVTCMLDALKCMRLYT